MSATRFVQNLTISSCRAWMYAVAAGSSFRRYCIAMRSNASSGDSAPSSWKNWACTGSNESSSGVLRPRSRRNLLTVIRFRGSFWLTAVRRQAMMKPLTAAYPTFMASWVMTSNRNRASGPARYSSSCVVIFSPSLLVRARIRMSLGRYPDSSRRSMHGTSGGFWLRSL